MNKQLQFLKKLTVLFSVSLLLCFTSIKAQTLNPGDLAVIGWNAVTNEVTIAALVDIPAGTIINITDRGWDPGHPIDNPNFNAFQPTVTGDGTVTWTLSSAVSAGTLLNIHFVSPSTAITLTNLTSSINLTADISVSGFTNPGIDYMIISGDQVFIYQGADANPYFIFGMNNSAGPVDANNWNNNHQVPTTFLTLRDSYLPNGTGSQNALTNGTNAIGLPGGTNQRDNVQYTGPITAADRDVWLARITDISNWTGSDADDVTNPITSAPTPVVNITPPCVDPIITGQPSNVNTCVDGNATFSITATGASAYQWQVDMGSGFVNISNGEVYSGVTTNTLNITDVTSAMNGYQYRCVAIEASCETPSAAAELIADLTATSAQTNVSCFGGSNGTATVTASGGTGLDTYTYSWNTFPVQTTPTASNLSAGNYTVTITDANDCEITREFTITEPPALVVSPSQTNVLCNGASTGSATVSVTGGTGPYTYSWAPSGGTAATATGLSAGTYTVTVTDNNGCEDTHEFTITEPPALVASVGGQMDVSCFGGSNGMATVVVTGGTGSYTYSWAPSGGTGATAAGLSPGTYTVTVTDAAGCQATQDFTITEPLELVASAGPQTDVDCNGAATGSATVNVTGGTGSYTYSWAPSGGTSATASGLAAGTYTVTVTDDEDCEDTQTFTITQPSAIAIAVDDITHVSTYGGNDGSATVSASGGTGGHTYSWNTVPAQTGPTASGLSAGTYTVTVTDENDCFTTQDVEITEPQPPVITNLDGDDVSFTEDGPAVLLDEGGDAMVTDPDSDDFEGGNLTISIVENRVDAEDILGIQNEGTGAGEIGVSGNNVTYEGNTIGTFAGGTDSDDLVISFTTSEATPSAVQALISNLTYSNNNTTNPTTDSRTISITLDDGGGAISLPSEVTVTIVAVNDAPSLTTSGGITTFTEVLGDTPEPVVIDADLTISDPDNTTLASATVTITPHFVEDILTFTDDGSTMGNIVGSYDPSLGVLTLTSPVPLASLDEWESALRAVTYSNTSKAPNTVPRTITFVVNDGEDDSSPATKDITVTDVNDPPTIDAPVSIEVVEDVATALTGISFDDADAGSAVVEVTFSILEGNGALLSGITAGVTLTIIESRTVILEGTIAAINDYITDGHFKFLNTPGDLDDVPLNVIINDRGNTGSGGVQTANEEVTITVRSTVPRITRVYSPDSDGHYGLESLITIHVEFDREVIATEVGDGIGLLLETGVPDRFASYASGSGEETLAFHYTVQPGDENTHLDYLNTAALELSPGSTIESVEAGVGTDLTLPAPGTLASLSGSNQLIVDGIAPVAIARDITLELDADGAATLVAGDVNDGSLDNLTSEEDLVFTVSQTDFDCSDIGPVVVTLTVTDEAGNEQTTIATVTVEDVTDPNVQTRNIIVALDADGQATITAEMVDDGSDDACGIATLVLSKTEFNSDDLGVNTITLTATDHSGNESNATATVVVIAFEDGSFVYDGTAKSLSITGELPSGVEVVYAGNEQTEVGTYTVTATINGGINYEDLVLTATLEITAVPEISVTFPSGSFVYDGTAQSLAIVGTLPEGVTVAYTNNGRVNVGVQTVTASIDGGSNYNSTTLTAELRITPATRTLNFPALSEKTYGDADFSGGATASSGETITYTSSDESVAEIVDGLIRITGAGSATITASVPENSNYSSNPQINQTLVVHKTTQTITFTEVGEVSRDVGNVQLDVSASSGLPVSLEVSDEQVATLGGTVLNIHRLGTVYITATQEGGANHEAAEPVTITVRVVDPSSSFPVRVHQAVSPNGDGINEFLMIEGIRDYPENRVTVFNRNGTIVWEASGYDNGTVAFRGIGTGQLRLSAGTYFYVVEVRNANGRWEHQKGYFVLRY